jgi:predicted lactoylglutathione lyase
LIATKQNITATKIFVNLLVKDLQRSMAFFTQLGYTINQHSPMKGQPAWSSAKTFMPYCSQSFFSNGHVWEIV